jgi:hypothetical protein
MKNHRTSKFITYLQSTIGRDTTDISMGRRQQYLCDDNWTNRRVG